MVKRGILVVAEDPKLCGPIQKQMQNDTTETYCVGSLSEVLRLTAKFEFCLIILDLQLSGIEMLEMVRIIRISQQAPILALTDPLESNQKIILYHTGVNALMEKPIRADVCAAQAESLICLCSQTDEGKKQQATLAFGETLVISPRFWQVFVNGELLELTKKEFELLHFFARRPRQVFSREQLFEQIWDYNFELGGNDTVKVHVNTLRKKLMVLGYNAIENIRGVGYRFIPPPAPQLDIPYRGER